ncbi:hypothetical protein ABZ876_08215 [Streptomyces sp. NPDC046931]|uniref:hypothetical protein n=1 Tax=Streptomyces sp. NPDC046931 TaxID=3154806 RepID=UPI0033C2EE89
MTDPTITDLRRELEKARLALIDAQSHLSAHAQMNAALHCATEVFYSPLHAKVTAAIQGIEHALARTDRPLPTLDHRSSDGVWASLVADLDRCQHGRHQGDPCGPAGACTGTSAGNPNLRPGQVIGYGLRGDQIVMPDREHKHDPAAWRARSNGGQS